MRLKLFLIFFPFFISSFAQIIIEEKEISPGVIHKKIINKTDTLLINILSADISNNEYFLFGKKANNKLSARELTSKMAVEFIDSGYNVIVAINADFFESDGNLVSNMISEGEIVKAAENSDSPFNEFANSQFAFTYDNKVLIEQFNFKGILILPAGMKLEIHRINSAADSNSIMLYNSFQGKYTPAEKLNWPMTEIGLNHLGSSGDTLFHLVKSAKKQSGKTAINGHNFILSANHNYADLLNEKISKNDTIKILLRFEPFGKNIRTLVGGWPRLVKDGENTLKFNETIEGIFEKFSSTRHPRSGVGFSEDSSTIFFITVDGRQESSRGMSLLEFADLMISEGVYQGLNLDGGGSTAMFVKNKIVNNPSDLTGERAVSNCLILIRKEKAK
jgi:hypothetical protein